MRGLRLCLLLLLAGGIACRTPKTVPEDGAILLHVQCAAGAPAPDELRLWVYDDHGRLWDDTRVPPDGALGATGKPELGTILIQPGAAAGKLRIHARGFLAGERILDGTVSVDPAASGDRSFNLVMDSALPEDGDQDDVPDSVDNCPATFNPAQEPCPDGGADAGGDGDAKVTEVAGDGDGRGAGADSVAAGDGVSPSDRGTGPADVSAEPGDSGLPHGPDSSSDLVAPDMGNGDRPSLDDAADTSSDRAKADDSQGTAADRPDLGVATADTLADQISLDVPRDLQSSDGPGCTADGGCSLKSQGAQCASNAECSSGFCADGVCCTNSCVGPCRSCNQPSSNGICQGYAAGSDPEHECSGGASCNGVGACGTLGNPHLANGQLCTANSQCQSGVCVDGVCCESKCDQPCQTCGTGACLAVKRADDVPECSGTKTCNPAGKCIDRVVSLP